MSQIPQKSNHKFIPLFWNITQIPPKNSHHILKTIPILSHHKWNSNKDFDCFVIAPSSPSLPLALALANKHKLQNVASYLITPNPFRNHRKNTTFFNTTHISKHFDKNHTNLTNIYISKPSQLFDPHKFDPNKCHNFNCIPNFLSHLTKCSHS
jgi:hypothetical protein